MKHEPAPLVAEPAETAVRDALVAVAVHGIATARKALALAQARLGTAEAKAQAQGLDLLDINRAIEMLTADAEALHRHQERVAGILVSLKAASVSVEASSAEVTSDESEAERRDRMWRNGYVSAVLGDAGVLSTLTGDDAKAWSEGWQAFQHCLASYERGEAT